MTTHSRIEKATDLLQLSSRNKYENDDTCKSGRRIAAVRLHAPRGHDGDIDYVDHVCHPLCGFHSRVWRGPSVTRESARHPDSPAILGNHPPLHVGPTHQCKLPPSSVHYELDILPHRREWQSRSHLYWELVRR